MKVAPWVKTLERKYPDKKAREIADEVIAKMDEKESMLDFVSAWNDAYVAAGGRIIYK